MSRHTAEATKKGVAMETTAIRPDHNNVEALAYELWVQRGCPIGSDQEDWFRAEAELRQIGSTQRAA